MAEEGALGGEEFPTFRAGQAVHVTVHAATVTGFKLMAAPTVRIKETLGERFPQPAAKTGLKLIAAPIVGINETVGESFPQSVQDSRPTSPCTLLQLD